jgi:anti-sigma B factor antagonist
MDMEFSDVGGVTKAVLAGRMDSLSVGEVETRFISHVVPKEQSAIIDMTQVSFIASLGIRMLLGTARALDRYGAKLALFGADGDVMDIIETTALSEIIPVVKTEAEAVTAVNELSRS